MIVAMLRIATMLALGLCSCSQLFSPLDGGVDAAVDVETLSDAETVSDADEVEPETDVEGDAESEVDDTACDDILAGASLCDGFEGSETDEWDSVNETNGEVAIQSDVVFRGEGALRAELYAQGGIAELWSGSLLHITTGELHARLYLFLPEGDVIEGFTFLWVGEPVDPYDHLGIQATSGDALGLWVNGPNQWSGSDDGLLPRDQWLCVQLSVDVAESSGSVELMIDGMPAIISTDLDTSPGDGFSAVSLGIQDTDSQGPFVFYIDEFAIGTAPLPCDS